jgi:antitoxin VapB
LSDTAKLFINGRSQAVRLPAAYRFEGTEVFVRRDEETGDVILSSKPNNWDEFLEALKDLEVPDDFLSPAECVPVSSQKDPFEGWIE